MSPLHWGQEMSEPTSFDGKVPAAKAEAGRRAINETATSQAQANFPEFPTRFIAGSGG